MLLSGVAAAILLARQPLQSKPGKAAIWVAAGYTLVLILGTIAAPLIEISEEAGQILELVLLLGIVSFLLLAWRSREQQAWLILPVMLALALLAFFAGRALT